jgi:hypothetical protein
MSFEAIAADMISRGSMDSRWKDEFRKDPGLSNGVAGREKSPVVYGTHAMALIAYHRFLKCL